MIPGHVFPVDAREADAGCDRRRQGGDLLEREDRRSGASHDVLLGQKDDSWSFPDFDTITVSVADAPRLNEILVVMAIADGQRLRSRCGTEPIR